MGVLECGRCDCLSIMCDDIIDGTYVCAACQAEFEEFVGGKILSPSQMLGEFRKFMHTPRCNVSTPAKPGGVTAREFMDLYVKGTE